MICTVTEYNKIFKIFKIEIFLHIVSLVCKTAKFLSEIWQETQKTLQNPWFKICQ